MNTLRFQQPVPGVGLLTIHRPDRHNALDLATMRAFAELIPTLAQDKTLRALIVTGAGEKAFCSGGDLSELVDYPDAQDGASMADLMGNALLALERLPFPVIAAINGYAMGGGSELALACDLRIAGKNAQIGFVHLRRGLIPGWGGGQRLLRLVGYSRALDLLLRAEPIGTDKLVESGLVTTLAEDALTAAMRYAENIASADAEAVFAIKALLQAGLRLPYEEALEFEHSLFPPLWTGETHRQSFDTFLNKRGKL